MSGSTTTGGATTGGTTTGLERAVADVLARDACSGCGLCSRLDRSVRMELDAQGYARPVFSGPSEPVPDAEAIFRRVCPGVVVKAPTPPRSSAAGGFEKLVDPVGRELVPDPAVPLPPEDADVPGEAEEPVEDAGFEAGEEVVEDVPVVELVAAEPEGLPEDE